MSTVQVQTASGMPGSALTPNQQALAQRIDRYQAQVVQEGGARFQELMLNGLCWCVKAAAAGVDPQDAFGTTAPIAILNPAASGRVLIVLAGEMGYASGTMYSGEIAWGAYSTLSGVNAAPSSGTALTPTNLLAGFPGSPPSNFSAIAGATIPNVLKPIRHFGNIGPVLASTAVAGWIFRDQVEGMIGVMPGGVVAISGYAGAGGSTPRMVPGIIVADLPAPSPSG